MFGYAALQRRLAVADAKTIAVVAHPGGATTELSRHVPGANLPVMEWITGAPAGNCAGPHQTTRRELRGRRLPAWSHA